MSPSARRGVLLGLERERLFVAVVLAVVLESAIRIALGSLHPVAAVLVPPVAAVAVLGPAVAGLRAELAGDDDPDLWPDRATLRSTWPEVVGVAVLGHAAALCVGVALYLLGDTALKLVLYGLGGRTADWPVAATLFSPLFVVAVVAFATWGLLVPAVERASAGTPRRAILAAVAPGPGTGRVVAAHAVAGCLVAAAVVTALVVGLRTDSPGLLVVGAGLLGALAMAVALQFLVPVHAVTDGRVDAGTDLPLVRVVLVVVLVAGLTAGAGALRATETRPTAGPEPLPVDPADAYATAAGNTAAVDHSLTVRWIEANLTYAQERDRGDRRVRIHADFDGSRTTVYLGPGTVAAWRDHGSAGWHDAVDPVALGGREVTRGLVLAYPGYWHGPDFPRGTTGEMGLPHPHTGEWDEVGRENGTLTVELTGRTAVADAIDPDMPELAGAEDARIRMHVDEERGVVTGGRARLNATMAEYDERVDVDRRYVVVTGDDVDVERPDRIGERSAGEWIWSVFAY